MQGYAAVFQVKHMIDVIPGSVPMAEQGGQYVLKAEPMTMATTSEVLGVVKVIMSPL